MTLRKGDMPSLKHKILNWTGGPSVSVPSRIIWLGTQIPWELRGGWASAVLVYLILADQKDGYQIGIHQITKQARLVESTVRDALKLLVNLSVLTKTPSKKGHRNRYSFTCPTEWCVPASMKTTCEDSSDLGGLEEVE